MQPGRTCRTFFGKPESFNIWAAIMVASGFWGGGLSSTTLPATMAAAAFSNVNSIGKLKGITQTTTPSGTLSIIVRSRSPLGKAPVGAIFPDLYCPI